MTDPALYKDDADSVLLTVWGDGKHTIATRDPESRSWLPPVTLHPVRITPKTPAELTAEMNALREDEAMERERRSLGWAK